MECPANQIQHLNVLNNTQAPYRYPSFVKIECKEGHLLSYNSTLIQCDYTGKWSVLPQCEGTETNHTKLKETWTVSWHVLSCNKIIQRILKLLHAACCSILRSILLKGFECNVIAFEKLRTNINVILNNPMLVLFCRKLTTQKQIYVKGGYFFPFVIPSCM